MTCLAAPLAATAISHIHLTTSNNATTGDAINTVGHEVSHYIDDVQDSNRVDTRNKTYKTNRESYADLMGLALQDYTGFSFAMNGYNGLGAINQKTGSRDVFGRPVATIQANNTEFSRLNPERIENRQFNKDEANVLDRIRNEINSDPGLTLKEKKIKTAQAMAVACADINCASGVAEDDRNYPELKALQEKGEKRKQEGLTLSALTTKEINADLFNYTVLDRTNDLISRHDEARVRIGGGVRTVAGAAGMFGGATLTAGGYATCSVTMGAGCAAATVGGIPLTYLGYTEARDGINELFGKYESPVGQQVKDSFSLKTHQGNLSPLQNLGLRGAIGTFEIVSAKFGYNHVKKGYDILKKSKLDNSVFARRGRGVVPNNQLANVAGGVRLVSGSEGVVTGGNSKVLGQNLLESMGVDKSLKWTGYQAQHIFPSQLKNHPVLQKIGINLDDASNGIFLRIPDEGISPMARHRGFHSVYNQVVKNRLDAIDVSLPATTIERQVFKLQNDLRTIQSKGVPLYKGQGATVELWERWLNKLDN